MNKEFDEFEYADDQNDEKRFEESELWPEDRSDWEEE